MTDIEIKDQIIDSQVADLLRGSNEIQALKSKNLILTGFVKTFLREFEEKWEAYEYSYEQMRNYVTTAKYMARLCGDRNIADEVERVMNKKYPS